MDVESRGELDVRVLTMNAAQRTRLRASGTRPPRLAATRLTGCQGIETALAWRAWLRAAR